MECSAATDGMLRGTSSELSLGSACGKPSLLLHLYTVCHAGCICPVLCFRCTGPAGGLHVFCFELLVAGGPGVCRTAAPSLGASAGRPEGQKERAGGLGSKAEFPGGVCSEQDLAVRWLRMHAGDGEKRLVLLLEAPCRRCVGIGAS